MLLNLESRYHSPITRLAPSNYNKLKKAVNTMAHGGNSLCGHLLIGQKGPESRIAVGIDIHKRQMIDFAHKPIPNLSS